MEKEGEEVRERQRCRREGMRSEKSYWVSKKEQSVQIDKLKLEVPFKAWETIHTEISQKYDDDIVSWLASESGLQIVDQYSDSNHYYKNYIFKKK